MDLHGLIMNLPHGPLPDVDGTSHALAYKHGHRDARHDAAELALAADAEIERLRLLLQESSDLFNGRSYGKNASDEHIGWLWTEHAMRVDTFLGLTPNV